MNWSLGESRFRLNPKYYSPNGNNRKSKSKATASGVHVVSDGESVVERDVDELEREGGKTIANNTKVNERAEARLANYIRVTLFHSPLNGDLST